MLCCAVLCCAVLCCAVLCCAVLCCAVSCCAVPCYAVLCCAMLCCPGAVPCSVRLCNAVLTCPVHRVNLTKPNTSALAQISFPWSDKSSPREVQHSKLCHTQCSELHSVFMAVLSGQILSEEGSSTAGYNQCVWLIAVFRYRAAHVLQVCTRSG